MSPKPVKQLRRGAFSVAHPAAAIEFAAENAVVGAVRGKRKRRRKKSKPAPRAAASRTPSRADQPQVVKVTWLPGSTEIPVAGLRYYPAAVSECLRGIRDGGQAEIDVVLVPEPQNPHDSNAVAIYTRAGQIGHIPRRAAAVLQPALISAQAHAGLQAGCPARADLRAGEPRIVLTINLAELGIDPASLGYS